jgi:hypothetical protein
MLIQQVSCTFTNRDAIILIIITLIYHACGSMLIVVGDFADIHKSTSSKTISNYYDVST